MSMKRKSDGSLSPAGSPSGPRAAKRRKNDRDTPAIPVHLKGMKSANLPTDDNDADAEEEEDGALMEEDDYTTQLKWQNQSKDNLR